MQSPDPHANSTLEEITGESNAIGSLASTSASSELPQTADRPTSREELDKSNPPESAQEGSRGGTMSRPGSRENEETRTPSSCSEGHQAREIDCDDLQDCDESLADPSSGKRGMEACDREGTDSGLKAESCLDESGIGSPPVALLPRLSIAPGERGPRPSPALHSKNCQPEPSSSPRQRGPLGALINWLDDADVDDVVDPNCLSEIDHSLSPTPPMVGESDGADQLYREQEGQSIEIRSFCQGDMDDDSEDVPSDKEGLPKAPPLASRASPHLRPPTPDPLPSELPIVGGYCAMPGNSASALGNEEEEWLARQRLTGAIGRLVRYCEGDPSPKDDILGLRCSSSGRIMVTAVRERGIAQKAGVVAGDELVSIDGRKSFAGHPAHVVHASLKAPVVLVFLGFVGKLQAEVRVKRPPEPKCGLTPNMDLMQPVTSCPSNLQMCDAVVFSASQTGSLMITSETTEKKEVYEEGSDATFQIAERTDSKTVMYELQREDARNLVFNSLGTMAML